MVELESFTKDITHSVWKVYQFGHGMLLFGWYVWAVVCWISSFCLFIRIWPIFSLRKRFLYGLLIWVKSQTIQWGHNILLWYAATRYTLSKKEGLANNNSQTINNINNQHYREYKWKKFISLSSKHLYGNIND